MWVLPGDWFGEAREEVVLDEAAEAKEDEAPDDGRRGGRGRRRKKKQQQQQVRGQRGAPSSERSARRARCMACGRSVAPASIEGFEAHSLHCARSGEAWAEAGRANRADPWSVVDRSVELWGGGVKAHVVGVRPRWRRWLPPRHELVFEGGRREEVALDTGVKGGDGVVFRFLSADEEKELESLRAARLEQGRKRVRHWPTSKAPISVVFHSFRLIFGRVIISRNGLERERLSLERARAERPR